MTHYYTDRLGSNFQSRTLNFPNDAEGPVVATLVRKKANHATTRAVLYIHGFIDYFFQVEMAEQFNQYGYDFYALDLRKYGRSYLPHQTLYQVTDLTEYDAEITKALSIIVEEHHQSIVLAGHSTGGLITTSYLYRHPNQPFVKALWVNSPFYNFNENYLKKLVALPLLSQLGRIWPKQKFPSGLNPFYVPSLHQQYYGEWDFDLTLKPVTQKTVQLSFIHAIAKAQKPIHQGIELSVPILVMHSAKSCNIKKWNKKLAQSDLILNVKDMVHYAQKIKGDVCIQSIEQGFHDLVLSSPSVRAQVYSQLFQWLSTKLPKT